MSLRALRLSEHDTGRCIGITIVHDSTRIPMPIAFQTFVSAHQAEEFIDAHEADILEVIDDRNALESLIERWMKS